MQRFVPEYRVDFSHHKSKEYALIIPVINEGKRILSLLSKLQKLSIHTLVDIIIIDGGSTDGSLEFSKLKLFGVESLLTKIGQGKLSAQLLCAYDYCLHRGYHGILTIDGNDKDDPKDIPFFIDKLKMGYDFVQASRFVEGGYSENTPLSRLFAIKLIHAPILSFVSGFNWTDTTQGFRAYSARMLFSEKIQIFRDYFKDYELLAYLSYIAPKLGFKCIEVGTSRIYPKGDIPTKISGVRGNLKLIKTLWDVCRGGFNP